MTELPVTDPKLIAAIADRDKDIEWQAFERIYRPALLASLRKQGLSFDDAEDCCQRVMLKVVHAISGFIEDGKPAAFRRWLFRIAKNESISHWRKIAVQPQTLRDSTACVESYAKTFEDSIELEYERSLFQTLVQKIKVQTDPRHWQAFWQTAVEGKPTPLVAKELCMSVGAVYVTKGRVLKMLQAAARNAEAES